MLVPIIGQFCKLSLIHMFLFLNRRQSDLGNAGNGCDHCVALDEKKASEGPVLEKYLGIIKKVN